MSSPHSSENTQNLIMPAFSKLSSFQAFLPQFDGESVVSPSYFISTLESVCDEAGCTDSEKLVLLKAKLRGNALSHVITSPQLAEELDYQTFRDKFLSYFEKKETKLNNQNDFINLKMRPSETVRQFASRVETATLKFFGKVPAENVHLKNLVESTQLTRFIEGMDPENKQFLIVKDPKTLIDAMHFMEDFLPNKPESTLNSVNRINDSQRELKTLIDRQNKTLHESISQLNQQMKNLTIPNQHSSRTLPVCQFCNRAGHTALNCRELVSQQATNSPPYSFQERGRGYPDYNDYGRFGEWATNPSRGQFHNSGYSPPMNYDHQRQPRQAHRGGFRGYYANPGARYQNTGSRVNFRGNSRGRFPTNSGNGSGV